MNEHEISANDHFKLSMLYSVEIESFYLQLKPHVNFQFIITMHETLN